MLNRLLREVLPEKEEGEEESMRFFEAWFGADSISMTREELTWALALVDSSPSEISRKAEQLSASQADVAEKARRSAESAAAKAEEAYLAACKAAREDHNRLMEAVRLRRVGAEDAGRSADLYGRIAAKVGS